MSDLMESPSALIALATVIGIIVGSFLNVVILRLPTRLMHSWRQQSREILELTADPSVDEAVPPGIVRERSHCPKCKHTLSVFENIPLISWIALRGRCRHCRARISIQYPIVELVSGLCSAAIIFKFGPSWQSAAGLLLTWTLVALAGIDLRTQLLPDQLTIPLLWTGLAVSLASLFVSSSASIVGAAIGYLSLWSVYWLFKLITGKEGMGYGDFKLLAALGAWMGASAILPIVLLSSLTGAIIGGAALAIGKRSRWTTIPFGPFLAIAGWTWFLAGDRILWIYTAILGFR